VRNAETVSCGSACRSSCTTAAASSFRPRFARLAASVRNAVPKRGFCTNAFLRYATASSNCPAWKCAKPKTVAMNHPRGSRGLIRSARRASSKALVQFPIPTSIQAPIATAMAEFGLSWSDRSARCRARWESIARCRTAKAAIQRTLLSSLPSSAARRARPKTCGGFGLRVLHPGLMPAFPVTIGREGHGLRVGRIES
jgi:hypothetical protein